MYSGVTTRFVQPDKAVSHFHLRHGDRIIDIGAGTGYFLRALSHAVGRDGKVYAVEIQKNLVDSLSRSITEWRTGNIEVVWGDAEESGGLKIADGIADAAVLVNTLFQFEDTQTALAEIARVTRKGGKLFVIDWSESFGGMGPQPDAVVFAADARRCAEEAGFRFERDFPAGEHHYGLAFRRT